MSRRSPARIVEQDFFPLVWSTGRLVGDQPGGAPFLDELIISGKVGGQQSA